MEVGASRDRVGTVHPADPRNHPGVCYYLRMALRRPRAKKNDTVAAPKAATKRTTAKADAPVAPAAPQPDAEAIAPVDETPTEKPAPPVSSPNHDEEW